MEKLGWKQTHSNPIFFQWFINWPRQRIVQILPFHASSFNNEVKYIGFMLKPNDYRFEYWNFLYEKIENHVSNWCHRWLTRGGKLKLVKSILEANLIYWHLLAYIPKVIVEKISKKCFSFLWERNKQKECIPLVKWNKIEKTKWIEGLRVELYKSIWSRIGRK